MKRERREWDWMSVCRGTHNFIIDFMQILLVVVDISIGVVSNSLPMASPPCVIIFTLVPIISYFISCNFSAL